MTDDEHPNPTDAPEATPPTPTHSPEGAQKRGAWRLGLPIGLIAIAIGILVWQLNPDFGSRPDLSPPGDFVVKCEECGHVLTQEEQEKVFGKVLPRPGQDIRMTCPECGEMGARLAERCPNDGTIFFASYKALKPGPKDRCPKCGWSRMDELKDELTTAQDQ